MRWVVLAVLLGGCGGTDPGQRLCEAIWSCAGDPISECEGAEAPDGCADAWDAYAECYERTCDGDECADLRDAADTCG